jgi:hypothetical protein
MKLSIACAFLMLAALASAGCSQPSAQTTPSTQGNTPTADEKPAAVTPAAANTQTPITGEYEGDFDGAAASATISGSAPRYTVHIIIGMDGCAGGALGPAQINSAGALIVRPADDADCTITMTPNRNGFSVSENQCQNLHGDLCAFNGELHRSH